MKVRGHTLVWGWTNPPWLTSQTFTVEQLAHILHEHITRVAGHYRGKVFAWDVVNEGFDEHGKVKPSIWYDQPGIGFAGKGTAYIEQTFRWAHAADPDALLFYNDGGAETVNEKSDAIYAMVRDFKRRGVPIDGVGDRKSTRLNSSHVKISYAVFCLKKKKKKKTKKKKKKKKQNKINYTHTQNNISL